MSSETEKLIGIVLCTAISASFIATTNVEAAPTFPPVHYATGATFDESREASDRQVAAPWYRPTHGRDEPTIEAPPKSSKRQVAGPWYRPAEDHRSTIGAIARHGDGIAYTGRHYRPWFVSGK